MTTQETTKTDILKAKRERMEKLRTRISELEEGMVKDPYDRRTRLLLKDAVEEYNRLAKVIFLNS